MRRSTALSISLLLSASVALPALANFDAKLTMTCFDLDDANPEKEKLTKEKAINDDVVRACLVREMLPATDSDVAEHALVFDSDTPPAGELRVIRRCDALVICSLSTVEAVQIASKVTSSKESNKLVALYELTDVGADNDGSMICSLSDTYAMSSGKFTFKASCRGTLEQDDLPCELKLKSGKLFDEDTGCL
jgi:hypothetical protein